MWLVYDRTGNEFHSGHAGFLTMAPRGLRAPGPLVDRWNRKRVLVGTQAVQSVPILLVPVAAWTGHLTVWVVLAVVPTLGLLNQFVWPAQSALLPRIVDDDELAAAYGPTVVMYAGGVGLLFLAAYDFAIPSIRRLPAVADVETLAN